MNAIHETNVAYPEGGEVIVTRKHDQRGCITFYTCTVQSSVVLSLLSCDDSRLSLDVSHVIFFQDQPITLAEVSHVMKSIKIHIAYSCVDSTSAVGE